MPAPLLWQDTYPAKIGGADALLFRSCINCPVGQGKIEFMTSGQIPLPPGVSQNLKEAQAGAQESLAEAEKEKNSVGEASLAEGFVPVWGSGRDLVHAVQTGNKLGMVLNLGFLLWDVASVAAGVVSFGTATAGMMAGKAGLRAALKAGGKVALGMASKKFAAAAAKAAALKKGLPAALKAMTRLGKVAVKECVTACFPAGTLVAVAEGYCNIEDIRAGDLVWAWEQEHQNLALEPVVSTSQREAHAVVEVHVGGEVLWATPEHPFLLATNEWQQAGQLVVGDELLRSDRVSMPVRQLVHQTERPVAVFNFEVADWHTYLVGRWMLVVHNGPCEDVLKWSIGTYEGLTKQAAGLALDAHHLVQAEKMTALLKRAGQTFDHGQGISILVPTVGHRVRDIVTNTKCISRWNGKKIEKYISEAEKAGKSLQQISRDLLAKDIKEMRRVYGGDVPNSALQELIKLHKKAFPNLFSKSNSWTKLNSFKNLNSTASSKISIFTKTPFSRP